MISSNQTPLLSLVITSYTTERLNDIYELISSIKIQTYKNMETIFVVERSNELQDKINAFIADNSVTTLAVVFSNEKLGLSAARNLGIKNAKGDIIAFVDDDVVLFPDWAKEMVKAFDKDSIIGVTGSAFPLWENDSLKWLPEEFYWLISCTAWTGWKEPRVVRGAFGSNMAFKREAFSDNCQFSLNAGFSDEHHDKPISEDIEFSLRLRKKTKKNIIFSPYPCVWHRVISRRLSFKFIVQRAHHVGCTRRIIRKYYTEEFGSFEQENQVMKGIIRTIFGIPKTTFTKPSIAWKKFFLIAEVLLSSAIGYIIPFPSYKLNRLGNGD
jgi:glycosyltransferase involved in cell wall biosynthesis